jgi:hypothetical protein
VENCHPVEIRNPETAASDIRVGFRTALVSAHLWVGRYTPEWFRIARYSPMTV